MTNRIRVILADDQSLITESFKVLLETAASDIEVVGTAKDGREAAALVDREAPGVVLMDVRMPVMDGVHAVDAIHKAHPDVKIIMLTTFDDDSYVHEAIRAGAVGYLLKDASAAEVVCGVRAVSQGQAICPPQLCVYLFQAFSRQWAAVPSARMKRAFGLTRRQQELIPLISQGLTNKEIASHLNLSEQTIKNHIHGIMRRIGVNDRLQVIDQTRHWGASL